MGFLVKHGGTTLDLAVFAFADKDFEVAALFELDGKSPVRSAIFEHSFRRQDFGHDLVGEGQFRKHTFDSFGVSNPTNISAFSEEAVLAPVARNLGGIRKSHLAIAVLLEAEPLAHVLVLVFVVPAAEVVITIGDALAAELAGNRRFFLLDHWLIKLVPDETLSGVQKIEARAGSLDGRLDGASLLRSVVGACHFKEFVWRDWPLHINVFLFAALIFISHELRRLHT
jgi:hypothetical protein